MLSTVPSSTFSRRFWRSSLTTRILSTTGLKSTPNALPRSAGVNAGPSAIAMPVFGLTRYTTLSEPTP